jgi:glutaminase
VTLAQSATAGSTFSNPISAALQEVQARLKAESGGAVATYIPELSKADPALFGLALTSREGRLYEAGDTGVPFTMQSVSKPFVYALALSDIGTDEVCTRVGVEPSGEPFNAISLEPETGRPANPMINAGAIVTCSLVRAANPVERFERIRDTVSKFAGRTLALDETVYASELETGDRNRALAYLMRNTGLLQSPVDDAVDVYFRQCALLVTARDLAVMAATLANSGVNPCTGLKVVEPRISEQVLSVMATCGMYDYSGAWLLHVGLPAKSGVSGALAAVSPSRFGLGLFSPPLDERGNSVRGIAACQELSDRFQIHLMHDPGRADPVIDVSMKDLAALATHKRTRKEREALDAHPGAIRAIRLQGDIEFVAAEMILASLASLAATRQGEFGWLVLDLDRVTTIHSIAARMLDATFRGPSFRGTTVAVADARNRSLIPCARAERPSLPDAIEWCEEDLIAHH